MPTIKINKPAFASEIQRYFSNHEFDMKRVDATLRTCFPQCQQESQFRLHHTCNGLRFDYTGELMMLLLERAYCGLTPQPYLDDYCAHVANAMQYFADGFGEDADLCYSHFLMHGINEPTLEGVMDKIRENARIIHETRRGRPSLIDSLHSPVDLGFGLKLDFDWGQTDDYFGICSYAFDESIQWPGGCTGYLAKFSIFTDHTNKTVYGFTIQGQQTYGEKDGKDKKKGRNFFRLTAKLGMDPRAFVIKKVADIMRSKEYTKIRVVKPHDHPMFIEQHKGFVGKYEPIIRLAGIQNENGCYLESVL